MRRSAEELVGVELRRRSDRLQTGGQRSRLQQDVFGCSVGTASLDAPQAGD